MAKKTAKKATKREGKQAREKREARERSAQRKPTAKQFREANDAMAREQAEELAAHQQRVAERVVDQVNAGALGPNVTASLSPAPASDPTWNEPDVEHVRAAQRICTCANGHDEGCPVHGTDDFARDVKTAVGAHLLANAGTVEPYMGRSVKQRRLDGTEIDIEDVEVERVSKTGAKLKAGLFTMSISDDDAEELQGEDPVTRRVAIASKMRARKDGGRVPNGTDWDRSLDKLMLKVEQGW